ncbi:MAG TPA: hypothetical protein VFJ51_00165 [Nitrososphaeraceae archaeon]|nr:hypothetical protein [Nitrososphaeraceae archaeon]
MVISTGIFAALLFLILNLSSSLFEQNNNNNSNGIAAIIGVGSISNVGEKGGVGWEGSSSFYSLFSAIPQYAYAKEHTIAVQHGEGPRIMVNNSNLKIETVFKGDLESPPSMAFLGPNDILVLEKNAGAVERIVNGHMLPNPVLKVPVASKIERGMLGIATARHNNNAAVTNTATTTDTTNTSNAAFPLIPFKAEEGNERR